MADSNEITRLISEFVYNSSFGDLTPKALDGAKLTLLDTLGVAAAGSSFQVGSVLSRYRNTLHEEPVCTVVGQSAGASVLTAAWANGTFANELDLDEGFHVGTHTVPAALALGEELSADGQSVLEAYAIGREVGIRLTAVLDARRAELRGPTYRGFWHVGIVGPIASSMVAGKLLGLGVDDLTRTIGIASCRSGGFRQNMGSMAKALHSGSAAREGILAALLAREGMTADEAILEGPLGLVHALCNDDEYDWSPLTEKLGMPYELEDSPAIKVYPACTPIHPEIDAILRAREQVTVNESDPGEDVERISADLHLFSMLRTDPKDECEAGFCSPYVLAAAFIEGHMGLETLDQSRLDDPRIRSLMSRVENREHEQNLTVVFKDGRTVNEPVLPLRRFTTHEEISEKARMCMGRALQPDAIEQILGLTNEFESIKNVRDYMQCAAQAKSL